MTSEKQTNMEVEKRKKTVAKYMAEKIEPSHFTARAGGDSEIKFSC